MLLLMNSINYFLIISMLYSCSSSEIETNHIFVSGPTDAKMLFKIKNAASLGVKNIIINSRGGRESIALDISEIIENNKMNLIIKGACTSACAQYLMVAASKVRISEDSIVSFHLNSFGILKIVRTADIRIFNLKEIESNSNRAKDLYLRKGVSLSLLENSTYQVEPICIERSQLGEKLINKYDFWIPNSEYLSISGFKFEGFWPTNIDNADHLVNQYNISGTKYKFGSNNKIYMKNLIQNCR